MATGKKKSSDAAAEREAAAAERARLAEMNATRGAPTNLRPGGVMEDRRPNRRRPGAAQRDAAIEES
jgi:hypothetical protein